jgi:endonuclease-3
MRGERGFRFHRAPSPYKVLIGTVLSQRTKDEVTASAERRLFKVALSPQKMLGLSEEKIAGLIYPVGFYRQKAGRIRALSKILLEKYGGRVPADRALLMELPGVSGKTADCVLCFAFGKAVIPVDVHVETISKRLGIGDPEDAPEEIRRKLHELIPPRKRLTVNWLMVDFGKRVCRSRPRCGVCPLRRFCRYYISGKGSGSTG